MPSLSLAAWTGWITAALMLGAGLVQLWYRLAHGRRAGLGTREVSAHVVLGLAAAGVGFLHPLTALASLGSPGAIGGGALALALGALAFVLLLAHSGLGLKLRDPALRKRPRVRARHVVTAALLVGATAAHALACIWGAE
jgi:hypothetical protein